MQSIKGISDQALLVILDGFGINKNSPQNAIEAANTPNLDKFFKNYPYTTIESGGLSVGLPKGVVGNSEVGHMNLGAGRPVRQDLVRINEAIEKDTLSSMDRFQELLKTAKEKSGRIHLMGLLSDGGVHSHIDHIEYLIDTINAQSDCKVFFHAFMDGRDTPKTNGPQYIESLCNNCDFTFASMQGRSIGMDRDRRWGKIEHAYNTFLGKGEITKVSPLEYLKSEYENEIYDEFITPVLFGESSKIEKDDCIFFVNFRPDRAVQLSLAFNDPKFNEFERDFIPPYYLCMSPYIPDEVELPILFDKEKVPGGISEYLSKLGKKQYKIAETEKYAHVTYFFNGGEKKPFDNEEHVLVPSPRDVETYDQKPEMSANAVCEKLVAAVKSKSYDFMLVNFANSDMVGHTGNFEAAVRAIETLDNCIGQLMAACEESSTAMLLTADHGNSDQMAYEDGSPHTSHTGAPVPCAVFHQKLKDQKIKATPGDHALKDIAPTVLNILNLERPALFTGQSIFE